MMFDVPNIDASSSSSYWDGPLFGTPAEKQQQGSDAVKDIFHTLVVGSLPTQSNSRSGHWGDMAALEELLLDDPEMALPEEPAQEQNSVKAERQLRGLDESIVRDWKRRISFLDLSQSQSSILGGSGPSSGASIEGYRISEQTKITMRNKVVFGISVTLFVVVVICAWILGTHHHIQASESDPLLQ